MLDRATEAVRRGASWIVRAWRPGGPPPDHHGEVLEGGAVPTETTRPERSAHRAGSDSWPRRALLDASELLRAAGDLAGSDRFRSHIA